MSINKAEQGIEQNVVNSIVELQRQVLEMKTHTQPIGSDGITVVASPAAYTGLTTVAVGGVLNVSFMVTPVQPILTLFEHRFTVYIDGHDDNHMYPYGLSMTAGMIKCDFQWYVDWALSSDDDGIKFVVARLKNTDSVSHDFGVTYSAILPIMPVT